MRLHVLGLCFCLSPLLLSAQIRWEGGFAFGAAGYQGDLAPQWYPALSQAELAYGLLLRRYVSPQWALRLDVVYAEISGSDQDFRDRSYHLRNFRFQTPTARAGVSLEWEPLGRRRYPHPYTIRAIGFSPYLSAGAGALYADPQPDFSQRLTDRFDAYVHQDQKQNQAFGSLYAAMGLGVKLDISPRFALGVEVVTQTAFTDYLDGVSMAGNPNANDWQPYALLTLSLRPGLKDSDGDGIVDKLDLCPLVKGHWTAQGCPDQDGDGVEDLEDRCPFEPGPARLNGCPDTDGDGTPDIDDRCPLEPGPAHLRGCPDTDGDGLADLDDFCPRLPGPIGRYGCPLLDTDADGDLSDEEEVCLLDPSAAAAQQIETENSFLLEWLRDGALERWHQTMGGWW
jgi:OmpA-OmpF porin, OOP family